jgi:hypothetical protein
LGFETHDEGKLALLNFFGRPENVVAVGSYFLILNEI